MLSIIASINTHLSPVQPSPVKATIRAAQVKVAKKPSQEVPFRLTKNVEDDRQKLIRSIEECLEISNAVFKLRQTSATNVNSKTLFITLSSDEKLAPVLDNFPLIPIPPKNLNFLLQVSFPVALGTSRSLNNQFDFGLTTKCIFPTN